MTGKIGYIICCNIRWFGLSKNREPISWIFTKKLLLSHSNNITTKYDANMTWSFYIPLSIFVHMTSAMLIMIISRRHPICMLLPVSSHCGIPQLYISTGASHHITLENRRVTHNKDLIVGVLLVHGHRAWSGSLPIRILVSTRVVVNIAIRPARRLIWNGILGW